VGAVVGDAFGGPLEGSVARDIEGLVQRRATNLGPWRYTDGAMFIALAESLRDAGTVSPVGHRLPDKEAVCSLHGRRPANSRLKRSG
jgi:hypothetical protein